MALTHRCMGRVLKGLGLQCEIYELYTPAKGAVVIHTNTGWNSISINYVLSALSWKPNSYKNKSAWYKWAYDTVVSKQWNDEKGIPEGKPSIL